MPEKMGAERFGEPTIADWFAARGIDDPDVVGPVVAAFLSLTDAPDYYDHFEALSDLVHLMSEEDALNGGGPGFSERWKKAKARAFELFEP